ncbi:MAG TPA: cellulase family glycosylhydrolase [Gammaproteobacteria bacterium]|nr:cellulase family glycosylhydrolase [Gammaproteobacteria bacterium]
MITNRCASFLKVTAAAGAVSLFSLLAAGCMASGANATAPGDSGNAVAPRGTAEIADSTLPPHWPWRGVTMVHGVKNGAQPADVDEFVKAFGINSVHLYPITGKYGPREGLSDAAAWDASMKWLDAMIAACERDHVMAIVHLTSFPKPGGGYYNEHLASFWNNPSAVNEIYTRTAALVKHLGSWGDDVVAFDIISEPTMKTSLGVQAPRDWTKIQTKIVQIIRAQDPGRWIVVKPGPWGGSRGYGDFSPLPFPKLVYSVHIYAPIAYTHQGIRGHPAGVSYPGKIGKHDWNKQLLERVIAPVVSFQQRYNVPVWVGEFSAVRWAPGSDQYLRDLVSLFESHGWGWSYFSVGGWTGWDPRFSSSPDHAKMVGSSSQRWQTLEALFNTSGA